MATDGNQEIVFDVLTPLHVRVRLSRSRWDRITGLEHPAMRGREAQVELTLRDPDEIRRSRSDPEVCLFYRLERRGRWTCAVVKRLDGDGFLITSYPTDAIKVGDLLWHK